jgi:hypothetical protein
MITAVTAVGALVFTGLSLKTSEQGQITERYSRAVEQLGQAGADKLQIRLGGIYALERLAHDSPEDQPTIVEVLSTFIRTTAGITEYIGDDDSGRSMWQCMRGEPNIPTDVQAALTVIGRRNTTDDGELPIDLSFTCLDGAKLLDANFSGVDFSYSSFSNVGLTGSDLSDADIKSASFFSANLNEVNFSGADLSGAQLHRLGLHGAILTKATHDEFTDVAGVEIDEKTIGEWW